MPTESNESILDRDFAIANGKEIIDIASPVLKEAINYSTNLFMRCYSSIDVEQQENMPVPYLYLHIIEMADGVEELISKSCANPAIPLLRSILESYLYLEYILKEKYTERSLAWVSQYLHAKLNQFEFLDESSKKGRESIKLFEQEMDLVKRPPINQEELHEKIAGIKELLSEAEFAVVEIERAKLREKDKFGRWPNWYQLFDGPSNLGDLALYLDKKTYYDRLYRHWSSISHAHDISRFFIKADDGNLYFTKLRDSSELRTVAKFAITMLIHTTLLVAKKFRPEEVTAPWYFKEIKNRLDKL